MEHLGRAATKRIAHRIPFFSAQSKEDWQQYNFHTYPEWSNWRYVNNQFERVLSDSGNVQPQVEESGSSELTKFVQRWLYFELLRAFFGDDPDFHYEVFISGRFVSTASLQGFLTRWKDRIAKSEDGRRELIRAQGALHTARDLASKHLAAKVEQGIASEWPVNDRVSLSILVLGQALTGAVRQIQQQRDLTLYRNWVDEALYSQNWGYSAIILHELNENKGLCKKRLPTLEKLLKGNTVGLLVALSNAPTHTHHMLCGSKVCSAAPFQDQPRPRSHTEHLRRFEKIFKSLKQNEVPKPLPRHMCTNRDECKILRSDPVYLSNIIKRGHVPLLRYKAGTLDVLPMEGWKYEFTVFSHVWEDGFGNFQENAVNKCVLERFAKLCHEKRCPPHFWIDTLAIPTGREHIEERRRAISMIHQIYRRAKCTIVLDSEMLSSNMEEYASAAMQITTSKWMTKIWTLQEAFLSRTLYFVFKDGVYLLDDIEEEVEREDDSFDRSVSSISQTYKERILRSERERLLPSLDTYSAASLSQPDFVALVWSSVTFRDATNMRDEALALAILFNLDTRPFDIPIAAENQEVNSEQEERDQEQRMCKLLDLLAHQEPCGIPPGIIFLGPPKISISRFLWAPRTWLSARELLIPDPMRCTANRSRLLPNGLEVSFPGFLLHGKSFIGSQFISRPIQFPVSYRLDEWYSISIVDPADSFPSSSDLPDQDLAVIAQRLPVQQPEEMALLVSICNRSQYHVQVLNRVWLHKETSQGCIQENVSKTKADRWDCPYGEELPNNHRWIVEGLHPAAPTATRSRRTPTDQNDSTDDDEPSKGPPRRSQTMNFKGKIKNFVTRAATLPSFLSDPDPNGGEPS